jgi:hypothetical protein
VIDAPGGGGKIPLLPEYVVSMSEDEVVLRNFKGQQYVYRQPREAVTAPADPEYVFQPSLLERAAKPAKSRRKTA